MPTEPPDPNAHRFGREIIEALEQSQSEIGEALHDTLCQTLSGAALMAKVLARRAASGEAVSAAELAQISEMLDRALESARSLSHQLQPLEAGPTALMAALERLAADTARTVPCEFQCSDPVLVHEIAVGLALYRIAEAAVQNALGPTPATHIRIGLAAPGGAVEVTVSASDAKGAGEGVEGRRLKMMRYRAAITGASVKIERLPDGRSRMTCRYSGGK